MSTPVDQQSRSRSFNASMERWRRERRGAEPDTVWGARALEALKPWEEGDLCLSHAVAIALETAYHEGKVGDRPRVPSDDVEHAPDPMDCEECAVSPPKRVVRATVAEPSKPAPIVRGTKGLVAEAEAHRARTGERPTFADLAKPRAKVVEQKPVIADLVDTARGTVAGYTEVIRNMPRRPVPAISNSAAARRHFENHPMAAPKQDEYLEGIEAMTRRRASVVSKPAPITREKPAPIVRRPIRK